MAVFGKLAVKPELPCIRDRLDTQEGALFCQKKSFTCVPFYLTDPRIIGDDEYMANRLRDSTWHIWPDFRLRGPFFDIAFGAPR